MINNPKEDINYENTRISRAIWAALQTQTSSTAKNFITKMVKEGTAEALAAGADVGEFAVGVSICTAETASPLFTTGVCSPGLQCLSRMVILVLNLRISLFVVGGIF